MPDTVIINLIYYYQQPLKVIIACIFSVGKLRLSTIVGPKSHTCKYRNLDLNPGLPTTLVPTMH